MPPLSEPLRKQLENAVIEARDLAEAGAEAALKRLAVDQGEPYRELTPQECELRNKLRARGQQLGDVRKPNGVQTIDRLTAECAYEYWHRMLFARFLAENHLLMHSDGVAVTLKECDELAKDEGTDGWTLASRYAALVLPEIFRPEDPLLQVGFAPEHKLALEKLLASLPSDVFTADDGLGWVYQFWQSKKKEEVNRSETKIGAAELPAVTQIFTEHYMVLFLLHNTIGAWWAGKLAEAEPARFKVGTEEEARRVVALPGYDFQYLRFVRSEGTDVWIPAAGTFPGWPRTARELKILDPCCGSGHFLVAAFDLVVRLRMQEEGLSSRDACDAVLRDNLYGLEIDPRCTQIAAFNLALAAWKWPEAAGYRSLPNLYIACSGIPVSAKKDDWLKLANGDERLKNGMERLWDLFKQAPILGSLIDPTAGGAGKLLEAGFEEVRPLLDQALVSERTQRDADLAAAGVAAQGLAHAAKLLAGRYHLVVTNVPYLARGKQDEPLKEFCESHYPRAKQDLATVFLERCLQFCMEAGVVSLVLPQNWLFLTRYKKLREELLKRDTWNVVARLGEGGFESIQAAGAFTVLLILTRATPYVANQFSGLDASAPRSAAEKAAILREGSIQPAQQHAQLQNPDHRITLGDCISGALLAKYAEGLQGVSPADFPHYGRCFWEVRLSKEWRWWQSTPEHTAAYSGRELVLWWNKDFEAAIDGGSAYIRGQGGWGKKGVCVRQMRELPATLYTGEIFDTNAAAIVPGQEDHLPAIWCFCSSVTFNEAVRKIDKKVNVTNATLVKVPFDLTYWRQVAAGIYPRGLPEPYSDDPTQWLFHGHPAPSTAPLQVAVARLLGYRWPAELDTEMWLAPQARVWIAKCKELDGFADADGVVCLPSVRGEQPAVDRLRALLAAAYGLDWSPAKEAALLDAIEFSGKSLEEWLRDGFFAQHCPLFHQRPCIWHIWDGRKKDGFHALVNYHKLDHRLLEKLTYTYLGDWITRQEAAVRGGEPTAEARLTAAKELQRKLVLILEGEPPYDIFVRWKPIEEQSIGWNPDLNDGVRLNIRPFVEAEVLRKTPNIKWSKDRGKNPQGSPWGEVRDNDRHLTLAEKRAARGGT